MPRLLENNKARLTKAVRLMALLAALLGSGSMAAHAKDALETPQKLEELQGIKGTGGGQEIGFQIRVDAMREAALSYGARGGLAWRSYEIRQRLQRHEDPLTRIYNFRELLIAAPGGLMIEPPVIGEALEAINIVDAGQTAAVADKILKISSNARLVTAPRDWRTYLERDWVRDIALPPEILLPRSDEERANWKKWVADGWQAGMEQADEIFQADMDRLSRDFVGMVRYRQLLAQAMVNKPFAVLQDRGVTGDGVEMRIGDRGVRITGPVMLQQPNSKKWVATPQPQ